MPLWKSATTTGATLKECHNENPPQPNGIYSLNEDILNSFSCWVVSTQHNIYFFFLGGGGFYGIRIPITFTLKYNILHMNNAKKTIWAFDTGFIHHIIPIIGGHLGYKGGSVGGT